ncbi:hypothetical protein H2248_009273 [Termitomyces sp. 'cryptogamus']|nr:hypothetical protein H2248_009273 [Termitomyces sp. 'cryptogamus']
MKRLASPGASPAKKIKLYHDLFEDSQQRSPKDILDSGLEDDSGYISCKCFMTWRPTTKHRAILETIGSAPRFRFDVEFSGACVEFFPEIELKAQDELLLALKSAQLEGNNKQSRLCTIPLKLVYEEGVIIKFLKRQGPCRVVDTWQLQEDARRHEDTWFLPPQDPLNSMVLKEMPSVNVTSPLHCDASETLPPSSSTTIPLDNDGANNPPDIPVHEAQEPKLPKKHRKKFMKQRRALMCASAHAKHTTIVPAPDSRSKPVITPSSIPQVATSAIQPQSISHQDVSLATATSAACSTEQTTHVVSARTAAGLLTATGRYHRLADLNDPSPPSLFNIIGVVVQVSHCRTRTEEWCCNVQLVDPSNTEVENLTDAGGFRVNCFSRKYAEWLPYPDLGEILIMRDLKISNYNGTMGIGYHGRLQWAIFSTSTGKIRYGVLGNAPESEGLQEGFGYTFSPFFKPEEAEIRYCLRMADWWSEVEKCRKNNVQVYQVCGTSDAISHSRPRRQHRLISEAGPHVPPQGYFDCTVEVLHGYLNENGVYSLYVTDYTANAGVYPIEASWCPPGLSDYVLQIQVWDGAVDMARGMFAGEYYSIENARMMMSRAGYVEGKVVEKKIQKLDVKEDGNVDSHFKALLERKKAWKEVHSSEDRPDSFEYKMIGEAAENIHFHCVVEVLRVIYDGNGTSCIYVTDYSSRNELVLGKAQSTWGAGLDGFILRIALFNNQAEMAKTIQIGAFYDIKKLRLKQSPTTRQFQGQLGGIERLIFLLNPKNSPDEKLTALKQRKEKWKKSSKAVDADASIIINPSVKSEPNQNDAKQPVRRGKTIAELRTDEKCPNKTRIFARVVDFRPWKLSDAVIIHCTNCRKDLPPLQKACFNCDDTDHEYVQFMFQMYFLLEDTSGDQIYVSVHDGSSIFDGLIRGDVSENPTAYWTLSKRLAILLGKLLELHSGPIPKDGIEFPLPNTAMLPLIIDTWDADGKHAYCLAGCDEMKNE